MGRFVDPCNARVAKLPIDGRMFNFRGNLRIAAFRRACAFPTISPDRNPLDGFFGLFGKFGKNFPKNGFRAPDRD